MLIVTPVISPEVVDETLVEGDNASFTCHATSKPLPTINWYFNGDPVNVTNTRKYTTSMMSLNTTTISSTLTIMSVQLSDTGIYTCKATNVISSDISSGALRANGEFYVLGIKYIYISHYIHKDINYVCTFKTCVSYVCVSIFS